MLKRNKKRDIISELHNLGTVICYGMKEIKLCLDDWNSISDYLHKIEDIIRYAGNH